MRTAGVRVATNVHSIYIDVVPDQIVEITSTGVWLNKARGFLEVKSDGSTIGKVPLDDILTVIVSVPGCSVSTVLVDDLCQRNIPLVICGHNYLPTSLILPVSGHNRQFHIMRSQVTLSEPRRKRAWQKIVRGKITNQSLALERAGQRNHDFSRIIAEVKSGDPNNCEAHAARLYWQRLFGSEFRRDQDGEGINAALNYIYAVVRACLARGIVGAGLHPTFSIHHKNPQNPLNLVDDLMEPFRPIADYLIWIKQEQLTCKLSPASKQVLSAIVNIPIPLDEEVSPLSLVAVKYCRAFAAYCMKERETLPMLSLPLPLDIAGS